MNIFEYDEDIDCDLLCGVDEAGRGPLAGDVYAAAVILPRGCIIDGLNDSKKLTEKKRELLYDQIIQQAVAYCVATASVEEIEQVNILNATFLAMNRAVSGLKIPPTLVLVDGNQNPKLDIHTKCIVKGDQTSACIAAASILAKVSRDRYMAQIDADYPEYLFCRHKGYGTALHYEMLDKYGESQVHRTSFLKKYYAQKLGESSVGKTKKIGNKGEGIVAEYLEQNGYAVIEKNYSCEHGEIDIIAKCGEILAMIEVKTRKKDARYEAKTAVTKSKQEKIKKTTLHYLAANNFDLQPRFDVAEVYYKDDLVQIEHIENAF